MAVLATMRSSSCCRARHVASALFAALLLPAAAVAAPPPMPAGALNDTSTTSYVVGGVRVIHRIVSENELVAVNLYLLGGSSQLTAETAGAEAMLIAASEYGSVGYPGRDVRLAQARTGSRIFHDAAPDWTLYAFRGVRSDFDSTWNVFADRLMRPTLTDEAVEIVRGRMLYRVRAQHSHPDTRIYRIADSLAFAGHAYASDPMGSEQSLAALTPDQLRAFHAEQMVTSRLLLVIVGNVSRPAVEAAVNRTLAQLPRGSYTWSPPPPWTQPRTTVTVVEQRVPTNYIVGYFSGPPSHSADYPAFRVAVSILGGIAGSSIRREGWSYAAGAPFLERAASGGGVYVTTVRPDTAISLFNGAIELIRENVVQRSLLQRYLSGYITDFYAQNESLAGQADFLARHELLRGGWETAPLYMQELRRVQGTDVRRAARQYMRNIQYVYLGDALRVPESVMTRM